MGHKVLLVDSDPQCNLTSYLVDDSVVDDLLDDSDTDKGQTVWSALKPIVEASGDFRKIKSIETSSSHVFLAPGDIKLSEFEAELTEFWGQCLQRKLKGFKGTTALSRLVNWLTQRLKVDYVFYDSGPNIGPLNRVILLDCDYFIVPVACDLFSVRALKTLGRTLARWIEEWKTIRALAPADTYLLPGMPRFGGYVPQNFRVYGGQPAAHHAHYLSKIDRHMQSEIAGVLRAVDRSLAPSGISQAKLGAVKNFPSLVSASQSQGVPMVDVKGAPDSQRSTAKAEFQMIAKKLLARTQQSS